VSDETKLLVKQGKLTYIVLKHVGILIAKVDSVQDKLDESIKCTIGTASAADDLKMRLNLLAEGQSYLIEADRDSNVRQQQQQPLMRPKVGATVLKL
jgi:hypothetical protein